MLSGPRPPNRDFAIEYPPGALPAFGLPAIGKPGLAVYEREFQILMALCGVGSLAAMSVALRKPRRPRAERMGRRARLLSPWRPLALGSVILYRYDPLANLLDGGRSSRRCWRAAGAASGSRLLGFGIAAKAFPAGRDPAGAGPMSGATTRPGARALLCLGVCPRRVVARGRRPVPSCSPRRTGSGTAIVRQTDPARCRSKEPWRVAAARPRHHMGGPRVDASSRAAASQNPRRASAARRPSAPSSSALARASRSSRSGSPPGARAGDPGAARALVGGLAGGVRRARGRLLSPQFSDLAAAAGAASFRGPPVAWPPRRYSRWRCC